MSGVRSGVGWDSHRLVAGRPLILGGVELPDAEFGLDGHSDADVLTHAIMDALLGAAGLGDIGVHFPDGDAAYEDADSIALLGEVLASVRGAGLAVVHVDATVMMERPQVGPHRDAIRHRLAAALGIDRANVNIKACSGEGMGFIGRGEGAAALAIATLEPAGQPEPRAGASHAHLALPGLGGKRRHSGRNPPNPHPAGSCGGSDEPLTRWQSKRGG